MTYKRKINIFITFLFSQLYLGVFFHAGASYYVIEEETRLCGEFIRGSSSSPNWLPEGWKSITTDKELENQFAQDVNCSPDSIEQCCKSQGYRYAGVPIGVEQVSDERKGAEFLAHKGYINSYSLSPDAYNLSDRISRKEIMKVIMNMSGIEIDTTCNEIFSDVDVDWGCKYIESALEYEYIVGDQAFRPNDSITKVEAIKLVFKAKNIDKAYNTGYWEEDYISSAYYYGYIDEKFTDYNEKATRGWIFSLAAKTHTDNWK